MICVDHLCYHYKGGRPILRDVSFELEDGHFLAVLGNNGVGKSTLLKCMNRILTADSGHCRIDGEDLLTLSHREIAKRVAFVAQHVPDTQMTVHDMVMLGRREAGLILLVRIAMGSVFTGGVSAFIFSIAGGVLAYAVMCLTLRPFSGKLLWVVSVFGAVAHNLGQLCAAVLITKTTSLFLYAPVLLASAIVTGVFTGLAAIYLVRRLDKRFK